MGSPDTDKRTEAMNQPENLKYGWFSLHPSCLQRMNSAIGFLILMCLANIFQSMTINGLIGVVISSLESRFGFTSMQSSWIVSTYDVSTVPVLAIVSYFGSRSHRPRWTALSLLLLVIGTIVFIIPHFATPVYNPGDIGQEDDSGLCLNGTRTDDGGKTENYSNYLAVFIIARVLYGIGAVPLYTIAVTYMDDCVSKEQFSLYIAFFYSAGVLGPALGYIVGGFMLTVFTDFYSVDTSALGIDSSSPRWVGAWWTGYLLGAVALLLVTVPLSGYPRDLPGAAEIRANKVSEAHQVGKKGEEDEPDVGGTEINVGFRELPRYFKELALNPTYVCLTLMVACDSLLIGGFTAFGPKYVQEQFSVSAAVSGMMFGIVVIPGGAGGTIAGGLIVKWMALKCAGIMKAEILFSLAIMVTGFMFLIICTPLDFAGVSIGYNNTVTPDTANFTAACNADCACDTVTFAPICSTNNIQYYSSCHAGCMNSLDKTDFYNCSCIDGVSGHSELAANTDSCTVADCTLVPLFMVIFFCAMFCLFACSGMNISATVRCLPTTHRSLGIGVQWIFLRLLGTVPGPLLFGAAFDGACVVFEEQSDGGKGQCLFYDKGTMALLLFAICLGVKLFSLVCIILAWKLYKPPVSADIIKEIDSKPSSNGITNSGFEHEPSGQLDSNGQIHLNENVAFTKF